MVVTFTIYTLVQKQRLSASVVFSALAGCALSRIYSWTGVAYLYGSFNMIRNCVFTVMHFAPTFIRGVLEQNSIATPLLHLFSQSFH
jgi:hypothetical protein